MAAPTDQQAAAKRRSRHHRHTAKAPAPEKVLAPAPAFGDIVSPITSKVLFDSATSGHALSVSATTPASLCPQASASVRLGLHPTRTLAVSGAMPRDRPPNGGKTYGTVRPGDCINVTAPWGRATRKTPYWGEIGTSLSHKEVIISGDVRRLGAAFPFVVRASLCDARFDTNRLYVLSGSVQLTPRVVAGVEVIKNHHRTWLNAQLRASLRVAVGTAGIFAVSFLPQARRFEVGYTHTVSPKVSMTGFFSNLGRPAAYVACTTKWREATVTSQLSLPNLNNDGWLVGAAVGVQWRLSAVLGCSASAKLLTLWSATDRAPKSALKLSLSVDP